MGRSHRAPATSKARAPARPSQYSALAKARAEPECLSLGGGGLGRPLTPAPSFPSNPEAAVVCTCVLTHTPIRGTWATGQPPRWGPNPRSCWGTSGPPEGTESGIVTAGSGTVWNVGSERVLKGKETRTLEVLLHVQSHVAGHAVPHAHTHLPRRYQVMRRSMESKNKRWGSHVSESLPLILRVPLGSPVHLGTHPLLLGKAVGPPG